MWANCGRGTWEQEQKAGSTGLQAWQLKQPPGCFPAGLAQHVLRVTVNLALTFIPPPPLSLLLQLNIKLTNAGSRLRSQEDE